MKSISEKISTIFGGDKVLWTIVILILSYSLVVIFSSSVSLAYINDKGTNHYLLTQIIYNLLGFMVVYVVHKINYKFLLRYNGWVYLFGILFVIMLFFVGEELNGEKRWLKLPILGVTFMPSDFLKIGLIMVLVSQLAKRQENIENLMVIPPFKNWEANYERNKRILLYTTIPLLLPIVLSIMLTMPKSLSTAMLLALTSLLILIIGGVSKREIGRMILCSVAVFGFVLLLMVITGNDRIFTWISRISVMFENVSLFDINPNEMSGSQTQTYQSRVAIAAGEIFGKGPGNSTQRTHLPLAYSDYVFAFIVEEHGLIGAVFVMMLYLAILFRAMAIFKKCDSVQSRLLVAGFCVSITLQAFLHICVTVGLMFVTGQTLPIISKGGSSVVFTCAMFGIVLSISREMEEKRRMLREIENREFIEKEDIILVGDTVIANGEYRNGGLNGGDDFNDLLNDENIGESYGVAWREIREE